MSSDTNLNLWHGGCPPYWGARASAWRQAGDIHRAELQTQLPEHDELSVPGARSGRHELYAASGLLEDEHNNLDETKVWTMTRSRPSRCTVPPGTRQPVARSRSYWGSLRRPGFATG